MHCATSGGRQAPSLQPRSGQVTSARPGARAIGFAYSGTFPDLAGAVEGEVTGYSGTSVTVLFDGWADLGDYRSISDEIAEMIRTAVIP